MKLNELFEGLNQTCIIVDVQPAYCIDSSYKTELIGKKIINFANKQKGKILMYVNAEDQGFTSDTINDIKLYWEDNGFIRK